MHTIVIIDDHPAFVAAARRLLVGHGFLVVGEAYDGASGLELVERVHPDVVLLDIQLPDLDGFEVAAQLAASREAPGVVLTSSRDAEDYGYRVQQAPARGFLGKAELSGSRLAALLADRP